MLNKKNVQIEYTKGKGPGGQHKNKVATCVRATHVPTGIVVVIDGRKRRHNEKKALQELERRVHELRAKKRAVHKKHRRDIKIHERNIVRTYDYKHDRVTDHRTGKSASIKQVLEKGKLDAVC